MKYYSISAIYGSFTASDKVIKAENSKEALENEIKVPVIKNKNVRFSVVECDEQGRLHYDRRKWHYYGLK